MSPPITEMSDRAVDEMAEAVVRHGLHMSMIDVDYPEILRKIGEQPSDSAPEGMNHDVVLSISTHFLQPNCSRDGAVRINVANLKSMFSRIQHGQPEPVRA